MAHVALDDPKVYAGFEEVLENVDFLVTSSEFPERWTGVADHIEVLRQAIRLTQVRHPFTINAIVVLPDHIHAVWHTAGRRRRFLLALAADQDRLRQGCSHN